MTMNRKWSIGLMAVATGVMIGCSTGPSTQTSPPSTQTNPVTPTQLAVTEDSLTPQEETLADAKGYSVQQSSYLFSGRRCRWFWVPSGWGTGWGWDRYQDYWDRGRWVLVCNRRQIPYWWHFGPFATYGTGYGPWGYDRRPPRFRPGFDRNRFDRDGRDRGGPRDFGRDDDRGGRRNPGPDDNMGGGGGRGPDVGGGGGRGPDMGGGGGGRGPDMGGGGGRGPGMGGGGGRP
jgi:hypothetical protein